MHKHIKLLKCTCESCQTCAWYRSVWAISTLSNGINTETCCHPPWHDNNSQKYRVFRQTRRSSGYAARELYFARANRSCKVDKPQAPIENMLRMYKLERRPVEWRYTCCKHLSLVPFVNRQLEHNRNRLSRAPVLFLSVCMHSQWHLHTNATDKKQWFRCQPWDAVLLRFM